MSVFSYLTQGMGGEGGGETDPIVQEVEMPITPGASNTLMEAIEMTTAGTA